MIMNNVIDYSIRKACLDDAKHIAVLFNDYRVFYEQRSDFDLALNFIQERLKNSESIIFISEFQDGSIRAFCQIFPSFSSVSVCRHYILNDLYVAESARGMGVASSLLNSAVEFAKSQGANGLTLETTKDNKVAQKLYKKLGWIEAEHLFYHYSF